MTMLTLRATLLALGCVSMAATASAAAPKPTSTAGTVGSGTLEAQQREYTPQTCSHNGNTALCTFAVVNRGNPLTLHAWPGDLRTLQLVDASHVPHNANRAYFVDAAGTHQTQLLLQQSDQGSIVVEFANVDSNSTASEFHLHSQIVAGVGFGGAAAAPATAAGTTPAATTPSSSTATSKPAAAPAAGSTAPSHSAASAAGASAPAGAAPDPAACVSNAKSAACRAALQAQRVCAKNAESAACKNATAHAQKMEAGSN